jgi:hypothetical protein
VLGSLVQPQPQMVYTQSAPVVYAQSAPVVYSTQPAPVVYEQSCAPAAYYPAPVYYSYGYGYRPYYYGRPYYYAPRIGISFGYRSGGWHHHRKRRNIPHNRVVHRGRPFLLEIGGVRAVHRK